MSTIEGFVNLDGQQVLVIAENREVGQPPASYHAWFIKLREQGEIGECLDDQVIPQNIYKFGSEAAIRQALEQGEELT